MDQCPGLLALNLALQKSSARLLSFPQRARRVGAGAQASQVRRWVKADLVITKQLPDQLAPQRLRVRAATKVHYLRRLVVMKFPVNFSLEALRVSVQSRHHQLTMISFLNLMVLAHLV